MRAGATITNLNDDSEAMASVHGSGGEKMQAPRAQRIPSVRELHGQRDVDDYAWMRDHDSAAFLAYLGA